MSAIMETEPGTPMVVVTPFEVRPRDAAFQPTPGAARSFRVGEHVRYLRYYRDENLVDHPYGWMAVFEVMDGRDTNVYAASDALFVTEDCWEGLRRHFRKSFLAGLRRFVSRQEAAADA